MFLRRLLNCDMKCQRLLRHYSRSDAATPYHSQQRTNPIPAHSLKLNQTIEVRAKDSPSKEKFARRLGLETIKGSKPYLTISSHVVASMLSPKKRPASILSWLRGSSNRLKENWPDDVEIWATNKRVCWTFPLQLDVTLTSHLSKVGKRLIRRRRITPSALNMTCLSSNPSTPLSVLA